MKDEIGDLLYRHFWLRLFVSMTVAMVITYNYGFAYVIALIINRIFFNDPAIIWFLVGSFAGYFIATYGLYTAVLEAYSGIKNLYSQRRSAC